MVDSDTTRQATATRLRMAREQAGLSQGQVAKLMKMHRPTVSEIEAGRRRVSAEEIVELARLYDVSMQWLASGVEANLEDDRIQLAARELAKLKTEDVDTILRLLRTMRRVGEK